VADVAKRDSNLTASLSLKYTQNVHIHGPLIRSEFIQFVN